MNAETHAIIARWHLRKMRDKTRTLRRGRLSEIASLKRRSASGLVEYRRMMEATYPHGPIDEAEAARMEADSIG